MAVANPGIGGRERVDPSSLYLLLSLPALSSLSFLPQSGTLFIEREVCGSAVSIPPALLARAGPVHQTLLCSLSLKIVSDWRFFSGAKNCRMPVQGGCVPSSPCGPTPVSA